jgi:hypothetical protein
MRIVIGPVLVAAVLAFSPLASAAGVKQSSADKALTEDTASIDLLTLAAAEEAKREKLEVLLAPIQSAAELASYLESREPDSPLDRLSPAALGRFIDSLTFNENGLTGYRTDDLQAELTAMQAYRILKLFGAQRTTPLLRGLTVETKFDEAIMAMTPSDNLMMSDHEGYRCSSRATCTTSSFDICMSGC